MTASLFTFDINAAIVAVLSEVDNIHLLKEEQGFSLLLTVFWNVVKRLEAVAHTSNVAISPVGILTLLPTGSTGSWSQKQTPQRSPL